MKRCKKKMLNIKLERHMTGSHTLLHEIFVCLSVFFFLIIYINID